MKVYNPNQEERAFLYQEAQDLAPLVKELGSLSILVENEAQSGFRVTFLVAPESMGLQIHAEDDNLFEAVILAKEEAQRQLNTLINALNGPQATAHVLH